eukprot:gene16191-17818_t
MKILLTQFPLLLFLLFNCCKTNEAQRRRGRCKSAVYAIPRPSNGKVLACCRFKKVKFVCNPGYKLTGGDEIIKCRKGRIYGTFPKCTLAQKQNCGLAGFNPLRGRIVGGKNSKPGDWPWMTAIYRDDNFLCGGALITASHVLTAAHCFHSYFGLVDTPQRYKIWLGRTKLNKDEDERKQLAVAEKIFVHNHFSMSTFRNDIAIIKLQAPVKFTEYVKPLCLPFDGDVSKRKSKLAYVAGWGNTRKQSAQGGRRDTSPTKSLKYTMLPIAEERKCRESAPKNDPYDAQTMLCAGYGRGKKDACYGDSGGPLVVYDAVRTANNARFYKWSVVGIVSWGEGCAQEKKYGYYTHVFRFKEWINNIIEN